MANQQYWDILIPDEIPRHAREDGQGVEIPRAREDGQGVEIP